MICELGSLVAPCKHEGVQTMSASQIQHEPQAVRAEYEEKLAQVIARNAELQQELQKQILSWDAERSQLKTKIVQLEHSVVDAIERSNNPLRTTLISEEKLRLLEEAKSEWSAQWTAERNQLLAELNRLRSPEQND